MLALPGVPDLGAVCPTFQLEQTESLLACMLEMPPEATAIGLYMNNGTEEEPNLIKIESLSDVEAGIAHCHCPICRLAKTWFSAFQSVSRLIELG